MGSRLDRIVCRCLKVTESALVRAIRGLGLSSVPEVSRCTGAGEGCTACHPAIQRYLERARSEAVMPSPLRPARSDSSQARSLR